MASKYDKTSLDFLLDFQTRLQGVGNSLAADLEELISSTDAALLRTIINKLPSGSDSVKAQMRALEKLTKEIETIRAKGFDLAEVKAYGYGSEVAKRAGSTVKKLADNRGKIFKKELSDKKVSEIVDYHPIDGKSISQWFSKMKADDLNRITQTVQRASVEGMSVSNVVKAIRGTKENDYKDGVLETTRNAATMTARTVINGVASNAMLETCAQNADVIDGIKFVATLDAKTCPFCGSYDGKIWKPEDASFVKRPPLHPNCRCTVIPYIDMGENLEGERPAANADFDKLAEDAYNQQAREKGWKQRYEDLSPSTRLKYYYQAQKDFTKETGKPAYSQVKGNTTFKDYFEKQDAAFQKAWLGPKRYALYKEGNYDPLKLGNPDTGYVVPVGELEKVAEPTTAVTPKATPLYEPETTPVNKKTGKPSVSWGVIETLYEQTERSFADMESGKKKLAPGDEQKVKKLIGLLSDIEYYADNEPDDYNIDPGELYGGVERLKYVYEEWKAVNAQAVAEPEPVPESATNQGITEEQKYVPRELPTDEEITNLIESANFGKDGTAVVEFNGEKYIAEKISEKNKESVEMRAAANKFYNAAGVRSPEGKTLGVGGGSVRFERKIDGESLGGWWEKASETERKKMRSKLREGFTADILLGNSEVFGSNGKNIVVDADGNPWRVNNSGAFGGGRKDWKKGLPDEVWTMTGRGDKINLKTGISATDYIGEPGLVGLLNDIAGKDWESALKDLDESQRKIIETRLENVGALAKRGNGFVDNRYKTEYTERVLDCSYMLTRDGFNEKLPEKIDTTTPEGCGWLTSTDPKDSWCSEVKNFVNSAPDLGGKPPYFQTITDWTKAQIEDSYDVEYGEEPAETFNACKYKILQMDAVGIDVTGAKNAEAVLRQAREMGYYVGVHERDQYDVVSEVSEIQEQQITRAINFYRKNPEQFAQDCETHARFHSATVLTLENVDFEGNNREDGTMRLGRTENYIRGVDDIKNGGVCKHRRGLCESQSLYNAVEYYGCVLTMSDVPHSCIQGVYFVSLDEQEGSILGFNQTEVLADTSHCTVIRIADLQEDYDAETRNIQKASKTFERYLAKVKGQKK